MSLVLHPYLYFLHLNIMMALIVVVCALLGYSLFLTKITTQKMESNFFIATSLSVFWLYVFAQMGNLDLGASCFFIFGYALFFGMIGYLVAKKNMLFVRYITPGIVVTLFFIIIFSFLSRNLYLTGWDEFSHWDPHAKILWFNHGFMMSTDQLVHKSYPPGGRLFYYLFYFISGYSDSASYLGQQLLVLSAIGILTQFSVWKNWQKAFWIYLLTIVLISILKVKLAYAGTLYMDPVTGVYLGSILVFYLASEKNAETILWMFFPMAVVSLFKVDVSPFVLVIAGFVFIDQCVCFNRKLNNRNSLVKNLLSLGLVVLFVYATLLWWGYFLKIIHVPLEAQSIQAIHFEKVKQYFFDHPFQNSFFVAFLKTYLLGVLKGPFCMGLAIFCVFLFILKKENDLNAKKRLIAQYALLFFGFFGYVSIFFILYQFSFSKREALTLASFFRYMNIYYLMMWLPTLFYFFNTMDKGTYHFTKKMQLLALILIMVAMFIDHHRQHVVFAKKDRTPFLSKNLSHVGDAALKVIPLSKSIYLIWDDHAANGLPIYVMKNYLLPHMIYSSAVNSGMIDQLTRKQLHADLGNSDYVLVVAGNKNTWHALSGFISGEKKVLIHYQLCMPYGKKDCQIKNESAFLFSVTKKNGNVRLVKEPRLRNIKIN